MRRVPLACLVAASLTVVACSDANVAPPVAQTAAPVIHGTLDTGTTHDTVVYLSFLIDATTGMGGACTGTLIAPNVVATARHCVSNIDETVYPPTVGADFVAKNIHVYLHTNPVGTGAFHSPDGHGVTIVHDGATTLENSDFALLVLDKNISTDYSPVRLTKPPTGGERVFVVGYGLTETTTNTTPEPYQRYWRDGLSISGVGPIPGYLGARELYMGESICQGDSGGPVMDHTTGALLAVTSRGGNGKKATTTQPYLPCLGSTTQNIFTRVDGFADMITKTLATVGRVPWEEGSPKPAEPTTPPPPPPPEKGALGSSCTGPGDCTSNLCIGVGGVQICSQTCDGSTPCPDTYECSSGYCTPASPTPTPTDDAGTTPPPDDGGTTTNPDEGTTSSKGGCAVETKAPADATFGLFVGLAALVATTRARRRPR